jgi:endonuclease VIII
MPEGDTIHNAALRVGGALVGKEIREIETPQARHRMDRWPERLAGRAVRAVEARGKHLLVRFEGDLTLHSHLRMGGKWGVYERGRRWTRSARRAWLVIRTDEHDVVQFDGPVLELMTDSRARFDRRLAGLGTDIVADDFDERSFLGRLREDDQMRAIGDALLDQRNVAGIGNIWKSEGCFLVGVDPWRRTADVTDDEALAIVRAARPLMRESARRGGPILTYRGESEPAEAVARAAASPDSATVGAPDARRRGPAWPNRRPDDRDRRGGTWVYDRGGLPCRRCGTPILARGQGDDNRTTYWCPKCQV